MPADNEDPMLPANPPPVDPYGSFKSETLRLVALVCRDSPQVILRLLALIHSFLIFLWLMI